VRNAPRYGSSEIILSIDSSGIDRDRADSLRQDAVGE
jgi:HD superfamily phosphohydrolase